jgi:hypothetical protein
MIRRGEGGGMDVERALMVARCWGCERVPPTCQHKEQDAGGKSPGLSCHQGPPFPTSSALAPTDVDGLFVRLMLIGRW